jgi:hypothetical protein
MQRLSAALHVFLVPISVTICRRAVVMLWHAFMFLWPSSPLFSFFLNHGLRSIFL